MVGAARPVWWSKMREVMCAETCDKSTAPADRLRAASVRLPRHRSSSAPQSTPALTRTPAAGPRVAGTRAASLRRARGAAAARSTGGGANLIFIAVTCSGARTFTLHVDTREAATADDPYRAACSVAAWFPRGGDAAPSIDLILGFSCAFSARRLRRVISLRSPRHLCVHVISVQTRDPPVYRPGRHAHLPIQSTNQPLQLAHASTPAPARPKVDLSSSSCAWRSTSSTPPLSCPA